MPETIEPIRGPMGRVFGVLADLAFAIGFLTRLPVPFVGARGPSAAWAFPVVGGLIGVVAGGVFAAAHLLGLAPGVAAASAIGAQLMLTGALHEDGLADLADGIGGGRDKARRLEIMKDSRIGAFGALALGLGLLTRWAALAALGPLAGLIALTAAGVLSRSMMTLALFALPPARPGGLAEQFGRPPRAAAFLALGFGAAAAAAATLLLGWPALFACVFAVLAALYVMRLAMAKLGGLTGDVAGATQQAAEIAALAVFTWRAGA